MRELTLLARHFYPEICSYLTSDSIGTNQIVASNMARGALKLNFNFPFWWDVMSLVFMIEEDFLALLQKQRIKLVLRIVIWVCVGESLFEVIENISAVCLFPVFFKVIHSPIYLSIHYRCLVVESCPFVETLQPWLKLWRIIKQVFKDLACPEAHVVRFGML